MKNEIIINEVKFQCPQEDGQIFVPVKPICGEMEDWLGKMKYEPKLKT